MKKIISTILCLAVLFSSFTAFAAVNAAHRNNVNVTDEGECGRQLVWVLYEDGELDIEITAQMEVWLHNNRLVKAFDEDGFISDGICDMYNYNPEEAPWYKYREEIKNVVVGDDVTYLGNYAFYNCVNMETVDIQSELLSEIGYDCFKNCEALDYIDIPERVSIIGSSAFEGCTNLHNITLSNNLQDIYYYTFCMCKNLKELKINDGVKEIWLGAFTNCFNLETIYIPGTVEKIGNRVFDGCDSLKTIYYSGNKTDWKNISIGSGNSEIDNAEIIFSDENDILDNKKCTLCSAEVSNDNIFYDEDDNLICQECYNELSKNKQECYICGEYFNPDDILYDEDDHLICQACYNELSESKQKCYICGEYFNPDDMLYDEDLICQECYNKIQNNDINEEINEIKCPHCDKIFEETNDVYDEYGYIRCPYCDGYVLTETEYYEEIEFATSDWAAEEVYEAYQNNLIPDEMLETALYKTISREEFAAVAVKLYENIVGEIPDVDIYDTPFTDCNYASEYNTYIAVAYELGITKGTSDTTFSPYENITREQLATMLSRVALPPDNRSVSQFADHNEISQYAIDAVYLMAMHDIIKGVGNNRFAPLETATKEQAILIALRMYNSYNEW